MHLRARTALASALTNEQPQRLAVAEQLARKLSKEKLQLVQPLVATIRAGIASAKGETETASGMLSQALEGFELADMALYAAVCRRCLGQTIAGERGQRLIRESDAWMLSHGIKNPVRMTQMMAPGFFER